jgi:hypothetical protein
VNPETTTLWRPTGEKELALVRDSGWRRWPPRLPGQPIFYPVLNEDYAAQIARGWNAKDGQAGFVTEFEVETNWLDQYETHVVGGSQHQEYWIPAEDLDSFNDHIVGAIEVVRAFQGDPPQDVPPMDVMVRTGLHPSLADIGRALPASICCETMKAHLTTTCTMHADEYACGDIVVVYEPDRNAFGLPVHDGGTSMVEITFCPWCGAKIDAG